MIGQAIYLMNWAKYFSRKREVKNDLKSIDKYFHYKFLYERNNFQPKSVLQSEAEA